MSSSSPAQKPGSTGSTPVKHGHTREGTSQSDGQSRTRSTPGSAGKRGSVNATGREVTTPAKSSGDDDGTVDDNSPFFMSSEDDRRASSDDDRPDLEDPDPDHPLGPLIRLRAFNRGFVKDSSLWVVLRKREPIETLMLEWTGGEPVSEYSATTVVDEEVTKATDFISLDDTPESLGLDDGDSVLVVIGRPDEQPDEDAFAMHY